MLESLLHWLGFGLCHQLPERSFFGGGVQVPVCARDAGIYLGFVISLAIVASLHRGERPTGMPRWWVGVSMGLLIAAMAWDGVTSYAGLRGTTNDLRLATGLCAGFAVGALLVPILNGELWRRWGRGRLLDPGWRFGLWLAGIPTAFVAVRWLLPFLGAAYPVIVAASILATYTTVNLVLVALLPVFDRRADRFRDLAGALAVALAATAVEVALSAALRVWLGQVAERLV